MLDVTGLYTSLMDRSVFVISSILPHLIFENSFYIALHFMLTRLSFPAISRFSLFNPFSVGGPPT